MDLNHSPISMRANLTDPTINKSQIEDNEDPTHAPATLLLTFATALLILLFMGVVGNMAAIISILKPDIKPTTQAPSPIRRRSSIGRPWQQMTVTNAYIVSLSAADLLFLLFCAPFQGTVYILNHWPYGWLICKLVHFCQYCTVYASVWILTAMSIDRYTAIGYPLKAVKWRRSKRAVKVSAAIWAAAALISSPWLVLYETDNMTTTTGSSVTACYDGWSEDLYQYRKWMLLTVACIGFVIPAMIIFAMAILIAKSIRSTFSEPLLIETRKCGSLRGSVESDTSVGNSFFQRRRSSRPVAYQHNSPSATHRDRSNSIVFKRRRRACWLVFTLALIFFIFQGPQNVSMLWINFDSSAVEWILKNSEKFFVLRLLAHMMTYVNSVLNPLLYGMASGRIRNFLQGGAGGPGVGTGGGDEKGNRKLRKERNNDGKVDDALGRIGHRIGQKCSTGVRDCNVIGVNLSIPPTQSMSCQFGKNVISRKVNVIFRNDSTVSAPVESSETFSITNDISPTYSLRRAAIKRATMRRMSSTVSAFV